MATAFLSHVGPCSAPFASPQAGKSQYLSSTMKLYIMRHGAAEEKAATGRDFDRVLTATGRERTRLVAADLGRLAEAPNRVLSSPLLRARETAQIVAEELKIVPPVELCDELGPGGDEAALVRRLVGAGEKRIMIVGHEPDLSVLAEGLVGPFGRGFEKSMVVSVRIREGERASLRFVLEPKTLAWKFP
jgi:phosphohistidine phosphatase